MHPMVVTLLGGVLIGLSAAWLFMSHGRIAGISGILGVSWRNETLPQAGAYSFSSVFWAQVRCLRHKPQSTLLPGGTLIRCDCHRGALGWLRDPDGQWLYQWSRCVWACALL